MQKEASHPSGRTIVFDEDTHTYVCDGQQYVSVTTFVDSHFPEFDTEVISARYAAKHGLNQDDVKADWAETARVAAEFGTKVHSFAEMTLLGKKKGKPKPTHKRERKYFEAVTVFIEGYLKKYRLVEAEKIVFSPDYLLAGTMDLVMASRRGGMFVFDWKTNKAIKRKNRYQKGFGPLQHLDDCNYNHYCLQLNLYRKLLEQEGYYEGMDTADMSLLFVKRNGVEVMPVPRMDEEIRYMLEKRKEKI